MILLIFTFAFVSVQADEVTDILEKCYKATGGKDKINNIESVKIKGTMDMTAQGISVAIYYVSKKPKMYMENEYMSMKLTAGYDGQDVWSINPMVGNEPQVLSGPDAEMTKAQLEGFLNMAALPFDNYVEQGIQAEYKGIQEIDGKSCHTISFIETDGSSADVFFDSVTYLMYKTQQEMNGQKVETFITDRLKNKGIIYPKSIEIKTDGVVTQKLTFSEIDTNFDVDDNIFKMPK
jgi:outer membrane lipoprotein-sorting protein